MTDRDQPAQRCEPPEHLRGVDGWHWVCKRQGENEPVWWLHNGLWSFSGWAMKADEAAKNGYRYLAPVTPAADVAALVEALEECANDLEAYVMREYSGNVLTPGNALRRARDLAPVDAARAALARVRQA
jgi:hypothetical protein